MGRILLDSNILIDVMRGYEPTALRLDELIATDELVTTVVTYLELVEGCQNKQALSAVEKLLENFQILPVDVDSSNKAAELVKIYNLSHGLLLADAFIAAIALTNSLPLLTRNQKDFRFINGLVLVT
ncbi:MAG: type II toxin-antitoxin system VapC family toxin [Cyanobacteria bacterium J06581_3]